ncbi:MAG TPA: PHP domain-containing protein [Methylomirabilota bacterium]|nr:PHP domain-containing protein [Methylomirabilota bacterium]
MPGGVDLHTHTTCSDGTFTPRALVAEAARRGVRVLAVTDHDSTDGLADAMAAASEHPPLTIVPGIEINCDVEGAEIHVLGYYMDYEAPWFQDFCRAQREERRARVVRTAERLAELGLPVDVERVFALVQEGSAGRPHIARVMVERGYVKTVREAFDRYLASGKPAHVPRRRLSPEDAVRLLRRAGGVPVLAHPGLANRDAMIPDLVAAGLMGIECYYPEHSPAQRGAYAELCRRHGLVATGGSDFHGPTVRAAQLGHPTVPLAAWEALRAKAAESRARAGDQPA